MQRLVRITFLFLAVAACLIAFPLTGKAHAHLLMVHHRRVQDKGFAITTSGDTLRGYFGQLDDVRFYFRKDKNGKMEPHKAANFKSIYLELKSEKILNTGGFIEYDYLPNKRYALYRKIFSGKDIYYDHNLNDFALNRIYQVLIVNPADHSSIEFKPDFKATKVVLIDYLNKQSKAHYDHKDFDNSIQVIQEMERLL